MENDIWKMKQTNEKKLLQSGADDVVDADETDADFSVIDNW